MSSSPRRPWAVAGIVCLVIGLMLAVGSFLLPTFDDGRRAWTNEKAQQYQQSAERIHQLAGRPTGGPDAATRQALREAQDEHDRLDKERRQAIDSAAWRATVLRWSGIALLLVGLGLHSLSRSGD